MAVWWAQVLDCMGGRHLGSRQTQNTHGTILCWDIEEFPSAGPRSKRHGSGKKNGCSRSRPTTPSRTVTKAKPYQSAGHHRGRLMRHLTGYRTRHPAGHLTRYFTGHFTGHLTRHLTGHLTRHLTGHLTGHLARHLAGHRAGHLTGHLAGHLTWQPYRAPHRALHRAPRRAPCRSPHRTSRAAADRAPYTAPHKAPHRTPHNAERPETEIGRARAQRAQRQNTSAHLCRLRLELYIRNVSTT